jgi:membrane-associated phospholipid phosphatase
MSLLSKAMWYFPYVVHPITVLGIGIITLIYYEWGRQNADRSALRLRIGGFLGAGVLALTPTAGYFLLLGTNPVQATQGNSWEMDALVASGLFIAAGVIWGLWRHFDWGSLVPGMMQAIAAVTVPYAVLSPVWNVSGHVFFALVPTLYLTLVDRRFWPLLAIPVITIGNRIYLDAHTVAQSVGGFLIGTIVVVGLYWIQTDGSLRAEPESTTP